VRAGADPGSVEDGLRLRHCFKMFHLFQYSSTSRQRYISTAY
jgi:hypothetical protein